MPDSWLFPRMLLLVTVLLALPRSGNAAWPNDPLVNLPVCTASDDQSYPPDYAAGRTLMVSDGAGGAIVVWADDRGGDADVYVQRISAAGVIQWDTDGVALCTATGPQDYPTIASDGAGGAIVAWEDYRGGTSDIYAQRISAEGVLQWMTNGVALCTAADYQIGPTLTPDGAGGAIVTWSDHRSGFTFPRYAQRISSAGDVQWAANGVNVSGASDAIGLPTIASDSAGGAIIAWTQDASAYSADIYAQRISADGLVQWGADGVFLGSGAHDNERTSIASDGAGGAVVAWQTPVRYVPSDIYAQRVSAAGLVQWGPDGVALCTATGSQYRPTVTSDSAGGAIVVWWDNRSANYDIYAQRVSSAGLVQWATDGVALCTSGGDQSLPAITADGAGGAIVAWHDERSSTYNDIYAQRISGYGVVQWTANGVAVSTAAGTQRRPAITLGSAGGAVVAWQDDRNGNWDIYAQGLMPGGELGGVLSVPDDMAPRLALDTPRPNPSIGGSALRFVLPQQTEITLTVLDVSGRHVRTLASGTQPPGQHAVFWDLRDDTGRPVASGLYIIRLSATGEAVVRRIAVLR